MLLAFTRIFSAAPSKVGYSAVGTLLNVQTLVIKEVNRNNIDSAISEIALTACVIV